MLVRQLNFSAPAIHHVFFSVFRLITSCTLCLAFWILSFSRLSSDPASVLFFHFITPIRPAERPLCKLVCVFLACPLENPSCFLTETPLEEMANMDPADHISNQMSPSISWSQLR